MEMFRERRAPGGGAALAIALVLLLLSVVLLESDAATAAPVPAVGATLPSGRCCTSAVWDGTYAYVFGGVGNSYLNEIVRFDPVTNTTTKMTATLPTGRAGTSAIWDGTYAYIFGGLRSNALNQIVRYDPATDSVTTMTATLPTGRYSTSAVWDGTYAYVFGGEEHYSSRLDQIVRYDPAADTVRTMAAKLPSSRSGTSAVWDGSHAYVFGGATHSTSFKDVVRYDLVTDSVTTLPDTLPTPRSHSAAVWDGTSAYLFGGGRSFPDAVVRFDPVRGTATDTRDSLPTARSNPSAIWDGTNAFVFGGSGDGALKEILRYTPSAADTTPPDTFVDSAIDGNGAALSLGGGTISGTLTLTFHSTDDGAVGGFDCLVDGGGPGPCTSPATFTKLEPGPHAIAIQAHDAAGNVDPSAAVFAWTVLTPAEAIHELIEDVGGLDASEGTTSSLSGPLHEAGEKLTNENPNDDGAACGKLQAFLHQVEAKRSNGQLTDAQADLLSGGATGIRAALACG